MANRNLGEAELYSNIVDTNSFLIEVNSSIKRLTLAELKRVLGITEIVNAVNAITNGGTD